jgi:hypothetical protein
MEPEVRNNALFFHSGRYDADEAIFFERELEYVKAKTYDIKRPKLQAINLLPISTSAGSGANEITYQQYDKYGLFKIIASYADDLPRADISGKEFTAKVRSVGGAYGYNIQEIRAAKMKGLPLDTRRAMAARRAYDEAIDDIAWFARPSSAKYAGLQGLLYNANITSGAVTVGATSSVSTFAAKIAAGYPEEVLYDLNKAVRDIIEVTDDVHQPNFIGLPIEQEQLISTTRLAAGTDTTIRTFFERNNPGINIVRVTKFKNVNPVPSSLAASNTDIMVCGELTEEICTLELPQLFEQFPAQRRNFEFIVNAHGRVGGVIVYYPLALSITEGI